jgi:hypothetical protein
MTCRPHILPYIASVSYIPCITIPLRMVGFDRFNRRRCHTPPARRFSGLSFWRLARRQLLCSRENGQAATKCSSEPSRLVIISVFLALARSLSGRVSRDCRSDRRVNIASLASTGGAKSNHLLAEESFDRLVTHPKWPNTTSPKYGSGCSPCLTCGNILVLTARFAETHPPPRPSSRHPPPQPPL